MNYREYRKFLVAVSAALATLAAGLEDDVLTSTEGITVVIAFLAAIGVYAAVNEEAA